LRGTCLRGLDQALFQDSPFEHPAYQSNDPWVSDAVLQKLHHPAMMDFIEKAFDISFYDVADSVLLHRPPQII
jgi:hypothetical protein